MNIVLLGYRGCGKSTVGRLLARARAMEFVDVDEEVCARFRRPHIAAVWQDYGEDLFREMEAVVVVETLRQDNRVIALGGGSVMHREARQAVKQADNAVRIYLRCSPGELLKRVRQDSVRSATRANPHELAGSLEAIAKMLELREPIYLELAHHVLNVEALTPQQAAERVLQIMR